MFTNRYVEALIYWPENSYSASFLFREKTIQLHQEPLNVADRPVQQHQNNPECLNFTHSVRLFYGRNLLNKPSPILLGIFSTTVYKYVDKVETFTIEMKNQFKTSYQAYPIPIDYSYRLFFERNADQLYNSSPRKNAIFFTSRSPEQYQETTYQESSRTGWYHQQCIEAL